MKLPSKFGRSIAGLALAVAVSSASAVPTLQLGILGGTYDTATETIISSGPAFTLYAFLQVGDSSATLDENYYISAALTPKTTTSTPLGSFSFATSTVNSTADMFFGTPPLDTVYYGLFGDLQPHSIFETYFSEFSFKFNAANRVSSLNTQEDPDLSGLIFSGTDLYYATFNVNVADLASSVALHFDLYNTKVRDCKSKDDCSTVSSDDFAPFSHDAQSGSGSSTSSSSTSSTSTSSTGTGGDNGVPEPGTLALFGAAILAGLFSYRRRHQAHA